MIHAIAILIASTVPSAANAVSVAQLDGNAHGYCATCPESISEGSVAALTATGVPGVVPAGAEPFDPAMPTFGSMTPEQIRAYEAEMHETASLPQGVDLRGAPVFDRADDPIGHIAEVESRQDGTILSALVMIEDSSKPAYTVRMEAEQLTIVLGEEPQAFEVFLDLHRDALLQIDPQPLPPAR
ncbi:hypothetical protein BV394_08115 [Brevirhabdus pacifica]|uniref:Uncharacterized protein n=1 Tax=Brevirhabdus pacifica TaxID=1267768 RepID=A0A1U7DID1_9RHOB|nr:hypothetical protein [Brevirhabdus pacifica]APX89685.1 hypothetical protein BV394_08115 [Brevirhabdus pacifica]OWU74529.1 hypothetical protein ATO5_12760 [Loktanella sp. 22II-4b]PJJ85634.1 hypothetical protein CLV77_0153 [Brevirhabdus pacifica]